MRRTLTAAALLGVFIVAPAGSAFAGQPAEIRGNAYGNCGVNSQFGDPTTLANPDLQGSYVAYSKDATRGDTRGERCGNPKLDNETPGGTDSVGLPS